MLDQHIPIMMRNTDYLVQRSAESGIQVFSIQVTIVVEFSYS
jgi:hypothetical protein